tara:strand:- start:364 stop:525 length:162 start_codon:yes stop_codon:yes gene_type:complete
MNGLSEISGLQVNSAQQTKTMAVAKKTLDIKKTQGKQLVDMIKKVGQSLDMKV